MATPQFDGCGLLVHVNDEQRFFAFNDEPSLALVETNLHTLQSSIDERGKFPPQSTARAGDSASTSQTAEAGAQGHGDAHQGIQLAKDIKEQCLQLTQRELSEKQGAEFDKAYIGQQLVAHVNMLAELQARQKYAGQELQPVIREGQQMAQQHLSQAKQIMEQLKDHQGGPALPQAAQRPNATQPQR